MISATDIERFADRVATGSVAIFPADTVYGLACDPENEAAVERLYAIKGRPAGQPAAVMFFSCADALAVLSELGEHTVAACQQLLPGPVTLLLTNPKRRFPLACGPDPDTLGLRVPLLEGVLAPLQDLRMPVLQSSANRSGEADARAVEQIDAEIRAAADCTLDGGELPGTPSTVLDLRSFERDGTWLILRAGALSSDECASLLDPITLAISSKST